jgi:pyruvate/2-oxoglutarate dehydrogenase complex dihydrolipoamide dehydrogenase (E3) component
MVASARVAYLARRAADYGVTISGEIGIDEVPEHLLVLGGGYVGLEFGQMFRRFGSRVTIVQRGPRFNNLFTTLSSPRRQAA